MAEYYGNAWGYGPKPTLAWMNYLQQLTAAQIGNGVRNLHQHESAFPPNPGQFNDLARTDFDWEHKRLHYVHPKAAPELEDMTAKEKRAAEGLDAIRKLRGEIGL